MKTLAAILALCLGTAGLAHAGELTNAAKGAKSKRQKSTSKVITNADVKSSKGKIIETPNVPPTPVEKEPTLAEKHAARRAADSAASRLRAETERLVADLEAELASIEQQYYDENDLNRRDTEIVKKFDDVKAKRDEALATLAALPVAASPPTADRQPSTDTQLP